MKPELRSKEQGSRGAGGEELYHVRLNTYDKIEALDFEISTYAKLIA